MKVLSQPMNDVSFDVISRGRTVSRVIADGRGNGFFCLDGAARGAYRTRAGLMEKLRAVYGVNVLLAVGQRRPPRRPPVCASGTGPPRPAPKPHPPTVKPPPGGTPQIAPRPTPPRRPGKVSLGRDWGCERWLFPMPQRGASVAMPIRVAPEPSDFARAGLRLGLADAPAAAADGRIQNPPRPRPPRTGGAGTGRKPRPRR